MNLPGKAEGKYSENGIYGHYNKNVPVCNIW